MIDEGKLLAQVNSEYSQGYSYVTLKRIQYRDRLLKRGVQKKDMDKININMIANAVDRLIAKHHTNELQVNFIPRDGFIGQEKADKLNYTAEFDNNEEDYQQLKYQSLQDKFFFGVSIRDRIGRDQINNTPKFIVINPLCRVPDPLPSQTGKFNGKNFRYMGFEMQTTFFDLRDEKNPDGTPVYSEEGMKKLVMGQITSEQSLNQTNYALAYNYTYPFTSVSENFTVFLYHHYTQHNGKRYLVTTAGDRGIVLRAKELPCILKEEKKRGYANRPRAISYRKPRRNDPFGESVCDKLEDKQTAKTILFNLNVIKAKKEALGGDFLRDSRLIKNKDDILKPTTYGRNIFIDNRENLPLSSFGMEIPRSQIKADAFNMINAIDGEARYDVSMDSGQYGVVSDKSMTATEQVAIQNATNEIKVMASNIDLRGEKDFWYEWLKAYQENMSKGDQKMVVLSGDFEYKNIDITKDDFLMSQDPYITIVSSQDLQAKQEKEKAFRNQWFPIFMQDQDMLPTQKKICKRMMLKANGKTPNQINLICSLGEDERQALDYVDMINNNIMPESLFDKPPERLRTFRIYVQKADNTDTKIKVMEVLKRAMVTQPKPMQPMQQGGQASASANAMLGANIAQQSSQQGLQSQLGMNG